VHHVEPLGKRAPRQLDAQTDVRVGGRESAEPNVGLRLRPRGSDVEHGEVEMAVQRLETLDKTSHVRLVSGLVAAHHVGVEAHAQGLRHVCKKRR
jgi:hypothetical protein